MSNQSAPQAAKHPDQQFQVVQKRSYGQGRRGASRDRPTFRHGEDPPRKKPPAPKESREQRVRPQSLRSAQAARGKESVDVRHDESWEEEGKSSGEKITSPNRFQKLDPDLENSTTVDHKKSGGRGGKTRSSSAGTRGTHRGKSPPLSKPPSDSVEVKDKTDGVPVSQPVAAAVPSDGVNHDDVKSELDTSEDSKPCENGELKENAKPESKIYRISYTKEWLLAMRHRSGCERMLRELGDKMHESMLCGKPFSSGADALDDSDNEKPAEPAKLKHPTALSLIREHGDSKQVCLSPQRRSFGSGCSWKETANSSSSTSDPPPPTPPPPTSKSNSEDRTEKYFHPTSSSSSSSSSARPHSFHHYQPPPPSSPHSHTPRVIDHVPLRERERDRRGAWRGRDDWRQYKYEHRNTEPEPEWMEFGPSDRSEVIELKGFEEEDKEDDPAGPPTEPDVESASPVENTAAGGTEENSNEFILEGFDFSTGLSICQELALDEEEEPIPASGAPPTPSSSSSSSSQAPPLSAHLMKTLRLRDEHRNSSAAAAAAGGRGLSSRPANALTLDEIQARENIEPQRQTHVRDDQTAFNKLVAVLQFSGAIDEASSSQQKHESSKPRRPPPISLPPPPPPSSSERKPPADFGLLLEEELGFDDELPPPPPLPPQHPGSGGYLPGRQGGGGGLHKMDPSMLHLLSQQQRPIPHPGRLAPHHTSSSAVPHQRDGGSWVYPEAELARQTAVAGEQLRQQQQQQQHRLRQQQQQQLMAGVGGGGGGGGSGGRPSNQWAVEMERRRLLELHQMERERMYNYPSQQMPPMSKPNISLLPTAVMRQIHNSKTNHSLSEANKTSDSSVMANRLDQDLTSKASQTRSTITSMLSHSEPADYPPLSPYQQQAGVARLRSPASYGHVRQQQQQQQHMDPAALVYPPRYLHTVSSHGLPAQNPYMY